MLLVLDSKAFSKYRLLMASRSIIIFTITKQNSCFPPQFSGVYLQASALTALLRWCFNSPHTWRESGRYQSGDISVLQVPFVKYTPQMQNRDVQKVHKFAHMRMLKKCAYTDTDGHINRLPREFLCCHLSVVEASGELCTVGCRPCHSWVLKWTAQQMFGVLFSKFLH